MLRQTTARAAAGPVTVRELPPSARFSLRLAEGAQDAAGEVLGLTLPRAIGDTTTGGSVRALRLGPDEWVLVAPQAEHARIAGSFETFHRPASLVDISHREVTFAIDGPAAVDLLAHGCPRDLDRLAPGRGVRTVFDGVGVVVWRFDDRFEVDVWRSFAPFLVALLDAAAREMASGL